MADSTQYDGIDKFLNEKPEVNNDPSKDLPRHMLGLPPIDQILGANIWTLVGLNIAEIIKNVLENMAGDPPTESNNNAQECSNSNSISSISDDSQTLNQKIKLIQSFTEIINFKTWNIKHQLREWKKIKLDKWILSTATAAMIELEDITEMPVNNDNSNKIAKKRKSFQSRYLQTDKAWSNNRNSSRWLWICFNSVLEKKVQTSQTNFKSKKV